LQERHFLSGLLGGAATRKEVLEQDLGRRVPVLVKLAPDLEPDQLKTAVDVIVESGLDGIIATNTTIGRGGVDGHPAASETGGLSGAALSEISTEILAAICTHLEGALPVIGVGGIMGAKEAQEKLDAGATLVQVYTGLIYAGPGLVKEILGAIDH
ncbi:MAG: quinone-dependent dihydroorotate dehydrogenase, partial [Acidobacteriota bacterium]